MSNVYWSKAILTSGAMVNGRRVNGWEELGGSHHNNGVMVLDTERDAALIAGLSALRARGVGGVKPISEAEYHDLKKKNPWRKPEPKSWHDEPLKVQGKEYKKKANLPKPQKKAAAAPAVESRQADEVPQRPNDDPDFRTNPSMFRPVTRKLSSLGLENI